MHVKILHYDRRWPRVENHLDARMCPDCGASVHGRTGQAKHRHWHLDQVELLQSFSDRMGIEPEQETPWTAAVDSGPGPMELEYTE